MFAAGGPATAAPAPTDVSHTQAFAPGTASFTIPADATSLTATVAGGQGGTRLFGSAPGGAGGTVEVDLGVVYDGQALSILVGPQVLGGGGGSYLATAAGFLAVAGGGGSNGVFGTTNTLLPGGAGGYATASPDGTDGAQYLADHQSGTGAHGTTAGAEGYSTTAAGPPTISSALASDNAGVLTASTATTGLAAGGSGLASGGAANGDQVVAVAGSPSFAVHGASGGGSGFVDPSLTILSTGPNQAAAGALTAAAPFITLTWTVPAAVTTPPAGTTPAGTSSGSALAFTGADIPWWVYTGAAIAVLAGILLAAFSPRRRRAVHRI